MSRRRVPSRKSKKIFSKNAKRHAKMLRVYRGGVRL